MFYLKKFLNLFQHLILRFDLDLIYGSPNISLISSGKPGPSSFISIQFDFLSLIKTISTLTF